MNSRFREKLLQNNQVEIDGGREVRHHLWPPHVHTGASQPMCNRGGGEEGERKGRGRAIEKDEKYLVVFLSSCSPPSTAFMDGC